jgi:hypothetical protein
MLVGRPAIDYLTLSEPHAENAPSSLCKVVESVGRPGKPSQRLGYRGSLYTFQLETNGFVVGTFFFGERFWNDKWWGLLIASGESAHWLFELLLNTDLMLWSGVCCTRIDVQVTIPWPSPPFFLRHLELTSNVTATAIHGLNEGNEWAETLYLGSRASAVLVRAYRKRLDEHADDWLRVEVEYKRQASESLFHILLGERYVGNWFEPVQQRCASLYSLIEPYLLDDAERPRVERQVGKTMHWLSTVVASCVCRMLDDDDNAEAMATLVHQWHKYALACQNRRAVV